VAWRAAAAAVTLALMNTPNEVSFTFTDGVLRPDTPLDLPEGARVRAVIRVQPVDGPPTVTSANIAIETVRRITESGLFRSDTRKETRGQKYHRH
jgi:predicted DNA-binding antitoxin AbrB/MazE fold protein